MGRPAPAHARIGRKNKWKKRLSFLRTRTERVPHGHAFRRSSATTHLLCRPSPPTPFYSAAVACRSRFASHRLRSSPADRPRSPSLSPAATGAHPRPLQKLVHDLPRACRRSFGSSSTTVSRYSHVACCQFLVLRYCSSPISAWLYCCMPLSILGWILVFLGRWHVLLDAWLCLLPELINFLCIGWWRFLWGCLLLIHSISYGNWKQNFQFGYIFQSKFVCARIRHVYVFRTNLYLW
jgi:hypothetical protein